MLQCCILSVRAVEIKGLKKMKKNPHWFINCMFFEKELENQDRPYSCNFLKKFEYDWSLKHIISSHTKI